MPYVPQFVSLRKIMRNVRTSCHWPEIRSPFIPNISKYAKYKTEEFGGVLCNYIILLLVVLIPTLS